MWKYSVLEDEEILARDMEMERREFKRQELEAEWEIEKRYYPQNNIPLYNPKREI